MLKITILSIIFITVAVGCNPTATLTPFPTATTQPTEAPDKKPPDSNESASDKVNTPRNTPTTPPKATRETTKTSQKAESTRPPSPHSPEGPDTSHKSHILSFIPASWLDKGIWISHHGKAIQSTGAPNPSTLEEFLNMSEGEQTSFFEALARAFPTEFVVTMRQSPEEWVEEFGLDLFSIKSAAAVGTTSRLPLNPAVLLGEFNDSEITQKLLKSGYAQKTLEGNQYYANRKDFQATLSDSPLGLNRTNRVFVTKDLFVASPETASVEEFLGSLAGETKSSTHNTLALTALESLGPTLATVILTRTGVFNPLGSIPLTHVKPASWNTLEQWEILAAGNGLQDGQPYFALTIAFEDPKAADSNLDELRARLEGYKTIVPQRFPESAALIQGWPSQPLDERCNDISIDAVSSTHGSTITVLCETHIPLLWTQIVDLRDLGFLVP